MCGTTLERRKTPETELPTEDSEQPFASLDVPEHRPKAEFIVSRPNAVEATQMRHAAPVAHATSASDLAATQTATMDRADTAYGSFMGQPLGAPAAQISDAVRIPAATAHAPVGGLTGPSFLGLSEEAGSETDYLLDDEPKGSHWRAWLMLFVVGALAALGYAQWRATQRGTTLLGSLPKIQAPGSPKQTADKTTTSSSPTGGGIDQPTIAVQPPDQQVNADTADQQQKTAQSNQAPAASDKATNSNNATQPKPPEDQKTAQAAEAKAADKKAAAANSEDENADESASAEPAKTTKAEPELTEAPAAANKPAKLERSKATVPDEEQNAGRDLLVRGQKYLYGQGVPKNCSQALTFIHSAANRGNAQARAQLAGMYATGNCAPFDRVLAYRWFNMALNSAPHNSLFQRNRDMLWREMSDQERQRARDSLE